MTTDPSTPERADELRALVTAALAAGHSRRGLAKSARVSYFNMNTFLRGEPKLGAEAMTRLEEAAKNPPPVHGEHKGGLTVGSTLVAAKEINAERAALNRIRKQRFNGSGSALARAIGACSGSGMLAILNGNGTSSATLERIRAWLSTNDPDGASALAMATTAPITAPPLPSSGGAPSATLAPIVHSDAPTLVGTRTTIEKILRLTTTIHHYGPGSGDPKLVAMVQGWMSAAVALCLEEFAASSGGAQ